MPGISPLLAGRFNVSGTFPSTPSTGQPSDHFTGTRYGMRPTAPKSRKRYANHSPLGVSISPPCATPLSASATRPSQGPVILSARCTMTVRIPPRGQVMPFFETFTCLSQNVLKTLL